jgi:hypothetical protein
VLAQLAEARTAAATRLLGDAVVLARRIDRDLEPLPEADVEATAWVPELVEAVDGGRVTADAARAARRGVELGARSPLARAVRAPLRRVLRSFVGGPLPAASRLPSRAEVTARVGTVAARRLTALEATGRTHTALDGAVAAAADAAAPLLRDAVAAARPDPPSPRWPAGAGEGNRTLVTSLEDWSSTIELHPQVPGAYRPDGGGPVAPRPPVCRRLRVPRPQEHHVSEPILDQRLRIVSEFRDDEREYVLEQLGNKLDRRLARFGAEKVELELSVKERDTASQKVVLECWIAGSRGWSRPRTRPSCSPRCTTCARTCSSRSTST